MKTKPKTKTTKIPKKTESTAPSSDLVLLVQSYEQIKADLAELNRLDKEEDKKIGEAADIYTAVCEVARQWQAGYARSRRVKEAEMQNVLTLLGPILQNPMDDCCSKPYNSVGTTTGRFSSIR